MNISPANSQPDPPSRCPRCEGYEATYHTFEGECSEAAPKDSQCSRTDPHTAHAWGGDLWCPGAGAVVHIRSSNSHSEPK